jgi:hypothetical protein
MLLPEMVRILEKQRLGFVATVSADGKPNLSPKGTFVAIDNTTVAFGEIRSPNTLVNLKLSAFVEINFVDPLSRKGFRAGGTAAAYAVNTEGYLKYISLFYRWPTLSPRIRHIVVISIDEASYLTSPVYDDGASESELRKQWTHTLLSDG